MSPDMRAIDAETASAHTLGFHRPLGGAARTHLHCDSIKKCRQAQRKDSDPVCVNLRTILFG